MTKLDEFRLFEKALSTKAIAALAKRPAFTRIADVEKLKDGTAVVLLSKPVTLAAANPLSFERTSDFFYVAELDGSHGIRIEDGKTGPDRARADVCVSLAGVVQTKPNGERYVELTAPPSIGAPRGAKTIPIHPGEVATATARPVSFRGVVKTVSQDGRSFTVGDPAGGPDIPASGEFLVAMKQLAAGHTVSVAGVVLREGADPASLRPVLTLRELTRLAPPPASGLAFYSFEEEGELAKDSSGNAQDARLVNHPQQVMGKQGRGLRFDGEKSYLQVPDLGLQPALTVAAWVNLSALSKEGISSILHSDGWTWGDLHLLVAQENQRVGVFINGVGELRSQFEFTPERFGQWVHVAVTYDAQARSLRLFVNGQPEGDVTIGTPRPVNLRQVKVGCWDGQARMWNGMMDEVRFYDCALPAEEIGRFAEAGTPNSKAP